MSDGRKWNAIPFIAIISSDLIDDARIPESLDMSVIFERLPTDFR
jgi:hypothetical protein